MLFDFHQFIERILGQQRLQTLPVGKREDAWFCSGGGVFWLRGSRFLGFLIHGVLCFVLCVPATEIPGEESLNEESGQCLGTKLLTADGCAQRPASRLVASISTKSRYRGMMA